MFYDVIILAAGQGKRMKAGKNKVFLNIANEPLIVHTLRVFDHDPHCNSIILPINQSEQMLFDDILEKYCFQTPITFVTGGKERQNSVYNGLTAIQGPEEGIVLVHDGARPFVDQKTIDSLVEKTKEMGNAIPGVRVKDTIKRVQEGQVIDTIERSSLWAVHTPQAFRLSLLKKAHRFAEENQYLGTDDASLVEWIGEKVYMVEDCYNNIKITTPEDLDFAEIILKKQRDNRNKGE